ncbi:hypothetical protein DW085_02075 [Clostridium sp. AF50-3]|jgi:hypothetical protein|uniref:hypothetical protein n=1 Tax=Clostridium sp. AF50-3 TaxID=2293021 RepID=UPI000E4D0130|nr:hypothetical protein [Clostridium sp. AF50-3]RHO69794.1 hypothetical protein DW085_02075 [Clostridium sp. AF50-3]
MIQKDEGGSYEFVSENGYHYELVEGFAIRDDDLRIPDKVFIKEPREVTVLGEVIDSLYDVELIRDGSMNAVLQEIAARYEEIHELKRRRHFEVIEDNSGGLQLFVYGDDGDVVYAASDFEYVPGNLAEAMKALWNGADPIADGWDIQYKDPQEFRNGFTEQSQRNGGWELVADENGVYELMSGAAFKRELEILKRK